MGEDIWLNALTRLPAPEPINLDGSVIDIPTAKRPATNNKNAGRSVQNTPSTYLWRHVSDAHSYIAVRVNQRPDDCRQVASKLASAALERGVIPVIFTTLADCGFDRFGFRVERIDASDPREEKMIEAELKRFWNIALEINVSDVNSLS